MSLHSAMGVWAGIVFYFLGRSVDWYRQRHPRGMSLEKEIDHVIDLALQK